MRRIVEFAKPAYAWAGVSRPVSTAAAAANTEAVRIGNAPTMTEKIAARNSANSRHAGTVSPSGGGTSQMTTASATVARRAVVIDGEGRVGLTSLPPWNGSAL